MPLDTPEETQARRPPGGIARHLPTGAGMLARVRRARTGLSAKLLVLTIVFVMLAEVLIFVPSVANYRVIWLMDRLKAAQLASFAAEAAGGTVPPALRTELLRTAEVKAVAIKRGGVRRLVLPAESDMRIDAHFDLSTMSGTGIGGEIHRRFGLIGEAVAVMFTGSDRILRVTGRINSPAPDYVEIVLPEAPLRAAMVRYGLNILGLSVIISMITAAFVYFALNRLLVLPILRISRNMQEFSRSPEDTSRIITPSQRADEIGTAERELSQMQRELAQLLLQKNRLAQLGLAVSKINHDLRNMLASAQLMSDRLTSIPDPTVQRFAPKLIASLDRAINLCNDTLKFGRAEEAEPRRDLMRLEPLVGEVADSLGLPREGGIAWNVDVDKTLMVDADRDHLFRVLSNLVRNSVQVLEAADRPENAVTVSARREGRSVTIEVRDTGPGVPEKARMHLFKAFQGSACKGGTGLGLTIASELVAAHGGRLTLLDTQSGAAFRIQIPDRSPW